MSDAAANELFYCCLMVLLREGVQFRNKRPKCGQVFFDLHAQNAVLMLSINHSSYSFLSSVVSYRIYTEINEKMKHATENGPEVCAVWKHQIIKT